MTNFSDKEDSLRSFSRAELEGMVRRWDFSEDEWACRDLLIVAYPDATAENRRPSVGQIFQCACWDTGQKMLYEACDRFGEPELKEKLLGLLKDNPHFKGFD